MKLLSTAITFSSLLSCALAQSLRRSLMGDQYNYEVIGSPEVSDVGVENQVGYSIKFTNHWTKENHPFNFPEKSAGIAHWSDFVWASHSSDYEMWSNGGYASPGIEDVAEEGLTNKLISEIESEIVKGNALNQVLGLFIPRAIDGATSIPRPDLCVDESHPFVSGIGMIAPSPDWFSGVYNLRLTDNSKRFWYEMIQLNVYAWDAGTEEGDNYSLDNDPTDPHETISPFVPGDTAEAVFVIEKNNVLQVLPVGTLTLELQRESGDC